jgi:hypothetical protein
MDSSIVTICQYSESSCMSYFVALWALYLRDFFSEKAPAPSRYPSRSVEIFPASTTGRRRDGSDRCTPVETTAVPVTGTANSPTSESISHQLILPYNESLLSPPCPPLLLFAMCLINSGLCTLLLTLRASDAAMSRMRGIQTPSTPGIHLTLIN